MKIRMNALFYMTVSNCCRHIGIRKKDLGGLMQKNHNQVKTVFNHLPSHHSGCKYCFALCVAHWLGDIKSQATFCEEKENVRGEKNKERGCTY